ncbi:ATP-grasp domain-containing protein [Cohnella herbarum]|uniref:ATP-grasp domain-containing protein n=1 Tax=Cohnella herbarum TaxID=2728023 RepID=A0A7Z2VL13_9BACL|nr:ATP-grasp domain-containing protein [Cohnella herbarum]QJD85218.1 ATP-grasp domain-containing protein [Cohnella herbarum]
MNIINNLTNPIKVLVAGIGGASLGTEIIKTLICANSYKIYGCDISPYAFGHYVSDMEKTILIQSNNYVQSVISICNEEGIKYVIPGGEQPLMLLNLNRNLLELNGIILVANSPEIIGMCSDKRKTFQVLSELGVEVPWTVGVTDIKQVKDLIYPCIIKPSKGSGGSSDVYLASNKEEATLYINYLMINKKEIIVQEYVTHADGEFTVGVLSLSNGELVGSIGLKRLLNSKLSVLFNSEAGIISSGYTQGLIDDFPDIRSTAEKISKLINSRGPINIQGRIKKGKFVPFEINPRFSASTHLRTMAGFNEIDVLLKYMEFGQVSMPKQIKYGYYLRSFNEAFVAKGDIISDQMDKTILRNSEL